MVQISHFFPLVFQSRFYGNLIVLQPALLSSFQLDLFLWQGHALPVAAQIMSECKCPKYLVLWVGVNLFRNKRAGLQNCRGRGGMLQETAKLKMAVVSLNNRITQGCANCQEAGLKVFLIRMNRFLLKFQLTVRVSIVLFKAHSHRSQVWMLCVVNVNDGKLRDLCRQTQVVLLPMLITLRASEAGLLVSRVLTSLHFCMLYTDVLRVLTRRENSNIVIAGWKWCSLYNKWHCVL